MSFRINRSSIAKKYHKKYLLKGTEGSSSARYGIKIPCKWANFNFIIVSPNLRWVGRNIYIEVLEKIPDTPETKFNFTLKEVYKKNNIYQIPVSKDLDAIFDEKPNIEDEFDIAYEWVTQINNFGYKYLRFSDNNDDGNNEPRSALIFLLSMHNFQFFEVYFKMIKQWSVIDEKYNRDVHLHNLDVYVEYKFEGIFDEKMFITDSARKKEDPLIKKIYDYLIPRICSIDGSDFILDRFDYSFLIWYGEAAPYLRRKKIESLHMSFNHNGEFPPAVSKMDLKTLIITGGNFTEIPESIGNLKNLKKFYISDVKISKLPHNIGKLESLEYFKVYNCPISKIPKEITNLKKMKEIQLYHNSFDEFPKELCSIKSLEFVLVAKQKGISSIPKEIGNLTNLNKISLFDNNISSLPGSISNLKNLELINLSRNSIETIPNVLFDLPNLINFSISKNEINEIPRDLFNLSNLKVLKLGGNKLSEIPSDIKKLKKLIHLHLNDNSLNKLPKSINVLNNLKIIDLQKNKFTHFPSELTGMKNLEEILLFGNEMNTNLEIFLDYPNLQYLSLNPTSIDKNNPILKNLKNKIEIDFTFSL